MSGNYKIEWTEPSYGLCFVNYEDYYSFKNAIGSPEQIYDSKRQILQKYKNQFPFNGDGQLFTNTWQEFSKKLPRILKVNAADQATKNCRFQSIFDTCFTDLSFKENMLSSFSELSLDLKNDPFSVFEDKISWTRNPLDGVKKNTGNTLKASTVMITPFITDTAVELQDKIKSAALKNESILKNLTSQALNSRFSSIIQTSFNNLKTNVENITTLVSGWSQQLNGIQSTISSTITSIVNQSSSIASSFQASFNQFKNDLINNATEKLNEAVSTLPGAFTSIGTLVSTPLPGISQTLSEAAGVISDGLQQGLSLGSLLTSVGGALAGGPIGWTVAVGSLLADLGIIRGEVGEFLTDVTDFIGDTVSGWADEIGSWF